MATTINGISHVDAFRLYYALKQKYEKEMMWWTINM